jgi:inosose dehydratase
VKDTLRWAYGLNQWNFRLDVFVRHEDHRRALQTLAATGFDAVELPSGTGRWDNIARPEVILQNHGSAEAFLAFLRSAGVSQVASLYWDPSAPAEEEEGYAFRFARNPADSDAIVEWSRPMIDFAAAVGAEQLVVRPAHSAWMGPPLAAEEYAVLGDLWNRIGRRAADAGARRTPAWGSPCTTTACPRCTPQRTSSGSSTRPTRRSSASRSTPRS